MVEAGVALLLFGAALLVAEAHVPGGVLGVAGGVALAAGAAIALAGAGGGAAVVGAEEQTSELQLPSVIWYVVFWFKKKKISNRVNK
jgi:membrane-bound ClpP family serine protease